MAKYYAVRKGHTPGVYKTWDECKSQVNGFSGAEYKSFTNPVDAENYVNGESEKNPNLSFLLFLKMVVYHM